MAEFLEIDSLYLDGFDSTLAQSVSPYAINQGAIDLSPAARKYDWTETGYSAGSAMVGEGRMGNVERSWPLQVRARFTSTHTNLVTNPRPYSVVTGWQAEGAGSTVTYASVATENVIQAVTTGSADEGMETSFTGTVAAYSAGVWVKVNTGTAPIEVLFDGETATAGTATTDWQFFKTENITLTAATRYLQIIQTDTGSRTIYVKMAGVVLSSTYPGYLDGACGDARWNGTAHASTSTALTGQDAIDLAYDQLAELGEKAIYNSNVESSETGGTGLVGHWTPRGATKGRTLLTVKAVEVGDLSYGYDHHNNNVARSELRLVCHPYALGPEQTWATGSKAAGAPALEMNITGVDGAIKGPATVKFTAGSSQDQRFALFGIQGRDYVSGTSLILRAADLGVSGYSGALTTKTDEVQTLSRTGTPASGTFTLTLDGKTTSAIAYNATAATIEAAIEALANVGTDNVACTGGPINTTDVVCTFANDLAGCNVSLMTVTDSVGGGDITNALTTTGVPGYVSASLFDEWTTICDTGNLTHVGSYRVWARVYDNAPTSDIYTARVRLTWGVGDSQTQTNDSVVAPAVADYSLVDLGQVHIPTTPTGTQRWKGLIEGKTSGTGGNTFRVVDVMFVPMETGAGEVKMVTPTGSTLSMLDNFGATAGGLTGDAATLGGNWASMGGLTDAVDFTESGAPDNAVIRTEASDTATDVRYGRGVVLGTGTPTNVTVSVRAHAPLAPSVYRGVIAHLTDNDNFVAACVTSTSFTAFKVKTGTASTLATVATGSIDAVVLLTIMATGSWFASLDGVVLLSGTDTDFASGTLSSGKSGIIDWNTTSDTDTRNYSEFRVSIPTAETFAVYKSQDLQFRPTGDALREDSAGSGIYTPLGNATISHLPELTPSGSLGITNRVLMLTSRNNPDLASDPLPDAFDATILGRPVFALARSST